MDVCVRSGQGDVPLLITDRILTVPHKLGTTTRLPIEQREPVTKVEGFTWTKRAESVPPYANNYLIQSPLLTVNRVNPQGWL